MVAKTTTTKEKTAALLVTAKDVPFPAICVVAPGHDASKINPIPDVLKLDFMFGKQTQEDIIDAYGKANAALKAIDKWVEAAKGVLKEKLAVPTIEEPTVVVAQRFQAEYTLSVRTALDKEKVQAYVPADVFPTLCKSTDVFTLKVTEVKGV